MIDFTNSAYVKMKQIDPGSVMGDIQQILINGEQVIGAYKAMRDYCVFTNNSLTQYNFILDCKRRSCVKPSARRRHRAKPELAFISSWADKQRHWDQVRKGWSPQIWKSNVGKRGSACWWLRCTLCWA